MNTIAIGFAGKIGSGKTTLSSKVSETLAWPYVSFGNHVRNVARQRGLDESREVLQEIGASLVSSDPGLFCREVLSQADWQPGLPIVIDGIRHVEVVEVLRRLIAPSSLRVVYIEVADGVREARLPEEGINNATQLMQIETHSTEVQVRTVLPESADLIVDGSKELDDLVNEIVDWVRSQT
jgi:dephospho-CoA kinase